MSLYDDYREDETDWYNEQSNDIRYHVYPDDFDWANIAEDDYPEYPDYYEPTLLDRLYDLKRSLLGYVRNPGYLIYEIKWQYRNKLKPFIYRRLLGRCETSGDKLEHCICLPF